MKINTPNRAKKFDRPSVWLEFSPLSKIYKSVNLGQGFPDWAPPPFVEEFAKKAVTGAENSIYARSSGQSNLTTELSHQYKDQLNHTINPQNEILITVGATEALYLSIMSFVERGDEVIVIEPAFDIYYGALSMAEAKVIPISLIESKDKLDSANDLALDWKLLEKSMNKKTKAIIINTPHNPTGKVFSKEELERFADLLKSYPDCLVIADEVYEHITYDESTHISIASIEGMFERTLSIYSAGKTFSVTGWKIGWVIGPSKLIKRLQICQQWVVFSVATPLQEAIALSINNANNSYENSDSYYSWLKKHYHEKRELLYNGLEQVGLNPLMPKGSFFILCNISKINIDYKNDREEVLKLSQNDKLNIDDKTLELLDYNFCRHLTINKSVTAIPTSAFYTEQNKKNGEKWVRFAFCKDNQTLLQAISHLNNSPNIL